MVRYDELKRMIKAAVLECETVVREQRVRPVVISGSKRGAAQLNESAKSLCQDEQLYEGRTIMVTGQHVPGQNVPGCN